MDRAGVNPEELLSRISERDKGIILLGSLFFWAKFMRRAINQEGFEVETPTIDPSDPLSFIKAEHEMYRQANVDIDGDIVGFVSRVLIKHPDKAKLLPHLSNQDILRACQILDKAFENLDICIRAEEGSMYEGDSPDDIAISEAAAIMFVTSGKLGIKWFNKIDRWKDRKIVVWAIVREKLDVVTDSKDLLKSRGQE